MSGDVQPRKRKDKKRKKDELGVEEPRGTAAALGEGDVFMHSQHDHGTGGHWCAKLIFFSLLGVLITLIGLIILENRGLSELEANAVESRYSGVLEGWIEDAPEDDHHDEHTLELKDHNDDEHEDDEELEIEKIEKEASEEEEPISLELPVLPEDDDDNDDVDDNHDDGDDKEQYQDASIEDDDRDDDEYLEVDETVPVVEHITAPAGKPFVEVEEDESSEKPPDTLKEEEEYERQQEELRNEEGKSSHMWLKLVVGGALLAVTHAVVRRATTPRDEPVEEIFTREETPVLDRRMTLIPEEPSEPVPKRIPQQSSRAEEVVKTMPTVIHSATPKQFSEDDEKREEAEEIEEEIESLEESKKEEDKELYSDDDEEIVEEKKTLSKPSIPEMEKPRETEGEEDEEVPDDVEIIDDEQLEEEMEDELDEEEISDVDDTELLSRLEAKYGRLPEPHRPGQKYKDGGDSVEDEWPGEPSDQYWRQQLDTAEQELRQDWLD